MIDQAVKQAALLKPATEAECIYAAGYFDADGHTGVYRRKSRRGKATYEYWAVAAVTSSEYAILDWFRARWGGWIGGARIRPNPGLLMGQAQTLFGHESRVWQLTYRGLRPFFRAIEPHLMAKREETRNALDLIEGMQRGFDAAETIVENARQARCYEIHKKLRARKRLLIGREPKKIA